MLLNSGSLSACGSQRNSQETLERSAAVCARAHVRLTYCGSPPAEARTALPHSLVSPSSPPCTVASQGYPILTKVCTFKLLYRYSQSFLLWLSPSHFLYIAHSQHSVTWKEIDSLENFPNTGVEKNLRNGLVWSFKIDQLMFREVKGSSKVK